MRTCKSLYTKCKNLRSRNVILCNRKNNLPNPIMNYNSILFYNFSQKNENICENILKISINNRIEKCFAYLLDFKKLLEWNYFIYRVLENHDKNTYIFHVYMDLKNYQIIELLVPVTVVSYKNNQYIEFQNNTEFGMPLCGRVYFDSTRDGVNTDICIYIKYPLPYYFEEMKINAGQFSLMIQEVLNKSSLKLIQNLETQK